MSDGALWREVKLNAKANGNYGMLDESCRGGQHREIWHVPRGKARQCNPIFNKLWMVHYEKTKLNAKTHDMRAEVSSR